MNNKKVGVVIVVLGLLVGVVLLVILSQLRGNQIELGCVPESQDCLSIESSLSITHLAVGVITGLMSLGFYLIFFSRGEEAILRRLEEEKKRKLGEEKFGILLRGFDENEQAVLKTIKDQPGIEQNTLKLKTGLSKAKISQILNDFEKKRLIRRVAKNKTYSVYLSDEF